MKQLTTIIAGLFLSGILAAQKPVFRYPFETEPKKAPDMLVMPHASGTQTAFLLKNGKKIEYLLTGPDFKLASSFTHTQTPDKTIYQTMAVPAGFIYNGKKLYNFIFDAGSRGGATAPGRDVLLMDVIDFEQKKSELAVKHTFETGEQVVNLFTYGNTCYVLSVPAGGDALSVCYIDSTLNKTIRTYPLEAATLSNAYAKLPDLLKKAAVVYPDREPEMEAATAAIKIIPQQGKLHIVSAWKDMGVVLAVIDLYNNKMDIKTPSLEELCLTGEKNSAVGATVLGNYLFVTAACKQQFNLAVYDYTTGKLVKKHESVKDDGAPAVALGGLNAENFSMGKKKNEKSLDNTGAFLKQANSGNYGVKAQLNTLGQYVLTVGAQKNSEETPVLPFPGVIRPETPGADYVPVFHHINYGTELRFNSSYNTAWFRTVLAAGSFDRVKQSLKPGIADKLRDMLGMEDKLPAVVSLFNMGGIYYYPWYDAETQQFTIRIIK